MNASLVDQIAAAVLYEGYILYPYRPALKNQQRWTFGGVYPRAYSEAQGGTDAWTIQTECLVEADPQTALDVKIRFLHLMLRTAAKTACPLAEWPEHGEPELDAVEALQVGAQLFHSWQEAVEREVPLPGIELAELIAGPQHRSFTFPASRHVEPLRSAEGDRIVGAFVRTQEPLEGTVELSATPVGDRLFRLTVRILNQTHLIGADHKSRDEALLQALVSTHTILFVRDGQFVSLIDPPDELRAIADECRNVGAWPVLVGEEGQRDTLLAAPIILYDYPQIAPESPGNLFDGTEIDEMLTLRILTLTDQEKQQMMSVEEHTRALLARTESLAAEDLLRLHGTIRGLERVTQGGGRT